MHDKRELVIRLALVGLFLNVRLFVPIRLYVPILLNERIGEPDIGAVKPVVFLRDDVIDVIGLLFSSLNVLLALGSERYDLIPGGKDSQDSRLQPFDGV